MVVFFDFIGNFQNMILSSFENYDGLKLILTYSFSFLFALISSFILFPMIIYLSYKKKFYAVPNSRSSHYTKIPTVGGVPLFIGFIIPFNLCGILLDSHINLYQTPALNQTLALITSTFMIFLVGLKDDLVGTRAMNKLLMQVIISFFLIFTTGSQITNLGNILGIGNLYAFSIPFTLFIYIVIINSINLIDGIDGLAGALTLLIFISFGIYFSVNEILNLALLSFSVSGTLISFLYFNFSTKRKIFMGDCGSLFIGLIIAFLMSSLLAVNNTTDINFHLDNAHLVVLSVLLYPFVDTLRVFIIRIYNKKSPFSPDKNHLHHMLLNLGYSHKKATMLIIVYTLLVTIISLILTELNPNIHFAIIVTIVLLSLKILTQFKSRKQKEIL